MIPILFAPTATAFTTNGVGRLSDAISCEVMEVRNGEYELEMEYPLTGAHFGDITHSAIIAAIPSHGGTLQAFRIYKITKPISGRVKISARHISYQLSFIPVSPFSAQGLAAALAAFKTNAAETCPFTLSADFTSTASYAVPIPTSIRSYLGGQRGSILDVYGGEWEWDNYSIKLHSNRGSDNGVTLRYGKNITDLKQEESIANTYTGIYPYWKSSEGQMVTLPEKVIHASTASQYPFQRTLVKDFSDKFENAPSVTQLRNYTNSYITANNIGIPSVGVSVSFVNLSDTEEYKDILALQTVKLCDTITVIFEQLGVEVKAKVTKTVWDVLAERYKSIEVGDRQTSLSGTIEEQIETVKTAPWVDEMQSSIDRATGVLGSGLRGHVVINRNEEGYANEILFLDSDNLYQAQNVIRINNAGIGFSTSGYGGPYANAWTIDGKLDADFIQAGSLCIGGSYTNKNGSIEVRNAQNQVIVLMNQNGVTIKNGSLSAPTISGGQITIGNNFKVTSDGTMTAVNGNFTGAIKGGTIKIGSKFDVDAQGNVTASSAKLTGGQITIGSKFKVASDGTMTATNGNFSGVVNGGSINIKNKFIVDKDGNMTAKSGKFSGEINAATLYGASIEGADGLSAGEKFWVTYFSDEQRSKDYEVGAGGFAAWYEGGQDQDGSILGDVFTANNGEGISDENCLLLKASDGKIYCSDVYPYTEDSGRYRYGMGYWIDWLCDQVARLWSAVGGGGGDDGGDNGGGLNPGDPGTNPGDNGPVLDG